MTGPVSSKPNKAMGYFFMFLLALQFGMQPQLVKFYVDDRVNKISVVLATELMKVLICGFVILASGSNARKLITDSWTFKGSLYAAAFPAACYALQNRLCQTGYLHLDSLTYNLLNQSKTLSAALCCYLVLGRRQSKMQILAMVLLLMAAVCLNNDRFGGRRLDEDSLRLGVPAVLGASFLSGFSGAVTQQTLQRDGRSSSLLSLELAVYGIAVLLLSLYFSEGGSEFFDHAMLLRWWTCKTAIPVLANALGGVLVGQITKHLGSVQKGFALIMGLVVTALLQSVFDKDHPLYANHLLAAVLTAMGMYLHIVNPYVPPVASSKKSKKTD